MSNNIDYESICIDKENDTIQITVKQYSYFACHGKVGRDALQLYLHLFYTARLQETRQVYAKNTYLKKGLNWNDKKLKKAKAFLHKAGMIEYKQHKDPETGKFKETYITIKIGACRWVIKPPHPFATTNALNNNINSIAIKESKGQNFKEGLELIDDSLIPISGDNKEELVSTSEYQLSEEIKNEIELLKSKNMEDVLNEEHEKKILELIKTENPEEFLKDNMIPGEYVGRKTG